MNSYSKNKSDYFQIYYHEKKLVFFLIIRIMKRDDVMLKHLLAIDLIKSNVRYNNLSIK